MAGVIFHFESNDIDLYSGRVIDLDAWYLSTQLTTDVRSMIVVNKTNLNLITPNADYDFQVVSELPDLPNSVYMCPRGNESIYDIDHSAIDWYVFGSSQGWGVQDPSKRYVNIPQNGTGHCHSQHVMTATMFIRHSKV